MLKGDMDVTETCCASSGNHTGGVRSVYNTPVRRKFMRTEKTEFNHIDEIIRRIALARFDVTINLSHNGKVVRQYRAVAADGTKSAGWARFAARRFWSMRWRLNGSMVI